MQTRFVFRKRSLVRVPSGLYGVHSRLPVVVYGTSEHRQTVPDRRVGRSGSRLVDCGFAPFWRSSALTTRWRNVPPAATGRPPEGPTTRHRGTGRWDSISVRRAREAVSAGDTSVVAGEAVGYGGLGVTAGIKGKGSRRLKGRLLICKWDRVRDGVSSYYCLRAPSP